jgi:senataxin
VSPAIPLDLAKPRDLVATINRGPSFDSQKHKQAIRPYDQSPGQNHHDATQEVPPDLKRSATHHNSPLTEHASSSNGDKMRAHPAKRAKKDKGSIFIPKKPNKVGSVP